MPGDLPVNPSINHSHKSSQALVELEEEYRRTNRNHSYHAGCIRLNHDKIKSNKEEKCIMCIVYKTWRPDWTKRLDKKLINALHLNSSGWSWWPAIHRNFPCNQNNKMNGERVLKNLVCGTLVSLWSNGRRIHGTIHVSTTPEPHRT